MINFAEFEGDASDPFDSAALKSINDMEELAKVLESSSNTPSQKVPEQINYGTNPHFQNYPPISSVASFNFPKQHTEVENSTKASYIPMQYQTQQTWNMNNNPYSFTQAPIGTASVQTAQVSLTKRQDLEDFYSRYYGNQKVH